MKTFTSLQLLIYLLITQLLPSAVFANEKIFTDTSYVISEINISGNKKTHEKVIFRELLFQIGDTVLSKDLPELFEKSKNNLNNTSLFNYITITSITQQNNFKVIYIILEERWYLWPNLIFEHAGRNLSSFLHEQDWSKVNYGLMFTKFNFRGRRETLKFKFRKGYKEQFQLFYENPFLFNSKVHGFSAEVSWFRQNETSVYNENNKQIYYKEDENYVLNYYQTGLTYKYRRRHYLNQKLAINYTYGKINDSVLVRNANFFGSNKSHTQYLTINYFFDIDKRNYRHYPLKGYYFEFQLKQMGLGLLKNEMKGISEFSTKFTQFMNIENRWHAGLGSSIKISSNKKQPFFVERGLGYDDFLRAYEYYVINGQHYFTARSFIKYELLPTQITEIKFFKWKKFNKVHYSIYANAFFDSGYVWDIKPGASNNLANQYLVSTGIGVDLVAYYDQIIRFEYSINKNKEHGFFLHVGKAF